MHGGEGGRPAGRRRIRSADGLELALDRPAQVVVEVGRLLAVGRPGVAADPWRGELLAVADQTMQPTQASLWLRTPPEPSRTPPGALASR